MRLDEGHWLSARPGVASRPLRYIIDSVTMRSLIGAPVCHSTIIQTDLSLSNTLGGTMRAML